MFRELQSGLFHNVDPKVSHSMLVIIALSLHNPAPMHLRYGRFIYVIENWHIWVKDI